MNRAQMILANVGGAAGWFATLSLTSISQTVAALATAGWFVAQTWVLIRRQRCTVANCGRRKTS